MGLFKSEKQKKLEERIRFMDRYPGSLSEFDILKGFEHALMDTGPHKYVYIDQSQNWEFLQHLVDNGCEGFIRYHPVERTHGFFNNGGYGTPVKRK